MTRCAPSLPRNQIARSLPPSLPPFLAGSLVHSHPPFLAGSLVHSLSNSVTHSHTHPIHSLTHPPTRQLAQSIALSNMRNMQPLNNRVFIYLQRTYRDQCKSNGIEWPQQAIIVVKPAATRERKSLLHNRSINDKPQEPLSR